MYTTKTSPATMTGSDTDTIVAYAVGLLIKKAASTIECYHGDLYRDGQFIREAIKDFSVNGGSIAYDWSFGPCGTRITTAGDYPEFHREQGPFRLSIAVERSQFAPEGSNANNRVSITLD